MADQKGLRIIGFGFGAITATVALVATLIVAAAGADRVVIGHAPSIAAMAATER